MTSPDEIIKKMGSLPPFPDTAIKLIDLVNNPDSSVEDMVDTIKYDQAITAEVLRRCNTAEFGSSQKINSLDQALMSLGTVRLLQLVLAVHANAMLGGEQAGYGLDPNALWKNSVATALASTMFANKLNTVETNLAFTAGLLHGVGKIVLNEFVGDEFDTIKQYVEIDGMTFLEAEKKVLGFNHVEIGAKMAESWKLPDNIVRAIRHHHEADDLDPPDPLVVHLGNATCMILGIGSGSDGLYYTADSWVLNKYGLDAGALQEIGMQLLVELDAVEKLFAI